MTELGNNELEKRTASFTDEEFARFERIMERKGHTAAPIGAALAQPAYTRSRCSRILFSSMYVFVWTKEPRAKWSLSGESSNHYLLERVLKHSDSSVSRAGRCNEPLSTTICSSTGIRIWSKPLFPLKTSLLRCNPITEHQHLSHKNSFSCRLFTELKRQKS